jgi:hypothetical protein
MHNVTVASCKAKLRFEHACACSWLVGFGNLILLLVGCVQSNQTSTCKFCSFEGLNQPKKSIFQYLSRQVITTWGCFYIDMIQTGGQDYGMYKPRVRRGFSGTYDSNWPTTKLTCGVHLYKSYKVPPSIDTDIFSVFFQWFIYILIKTNRMDLIAINP